MDATIALTLIEAVLILLAIAISKAITLFSPVDDSCKNVESITTVSSPSNIIVAPPATKCDVAPPAIKWDVFLSFSGEDTRRTFSRYLYEALCTENIHTFMDHKLRKGEYISTTLLQTIEESKISLIIFSKNYASSTWCMDELVHIMKCKDQYGRTVIPIFYNVDPSNVRKQNESFGDGFAQLKQRVKQDQERVQKWENALMLSTSLSGWDSKNFGIEPELIKMIVNDILSKLHNKSSFHLEEGLVGIDYHIKKVEGLLREARIVGIWGMGGIGKTTLAKAVFGRLRGQFDSIYFAKDVRRQVERNGLDELQEKCFKELFKDEDINTYNLGFTSVKERLHHKKILLVLDDVDNVIAIEDLIKACGWFGEESRIIITSRDEQVLKNCCALKTYGVPQLDSRQAFQLFSLKAFKQNEPSKSHLELSKRVVDYCKGNPLALIVLGRFLQDRGEEVWESAMKKLNQTLHKDIFNVLKLSFDGLDDTQQNVFLDLAFFLYDGWGISLEDCSRHLDDSYALMDISVLKDRSLISVDEDGYIKMHALLIEMGLEICKQQLISNPEKPIRLRIPEDMNDVFNNDKGIEAIRCLSLDASKMKKTTLRASHFRKMHNLRFLKVYKSESKEPSKLDICEDLDYVSEELRFFSWEEYPLSYVPLHLCAENLITLEMSHSNIQQFFDGNQHFPNLKSIGLSYSKHLMALPELSHAPKLEFLSLRGCVNLAQIRSSTKPGRDVEFLIYDDGPVQMNIGGSVEGKSSGLVIVHNYLNLYDWSFNKITTKLFVSGKNIFSVRVKHVVIPIGKKPKVAERIWSLWSLLPFVRRVEWLESPVEFGDDFNRYCTYNFDYYWDYWDEEEDDELRDEEEDDDYWDEEEDDDYWDEEEDDELIMEYGCRNTATSMEVEEEDDDDELIMEYCCSNSADIFTRVPNSVTRWSLLSKLRLKESDIIGNAGSTIAQVSILKSLVALSHHDYCRRIKPRLDVTHSFDSPSSALRGDHFDVYYTVRKNRQRRRYWGANNLQLIYEGGTLWVGILGMVPPALYFTISFSRKLG